MTTPKSTGSRYGIILIAGLLLACGGLVWWEVQQQSAVEQMQAEEGVLQTKLEAANRIIAVMSSHSGKASVAAEAPDTGSSAAAATADRATAERKRIMNATEMTVLMSSSGMQKIMASQQAVMQQMIYSDLMNHLQLSPEERDYLQKLLLEREMNLANLGIQLTNPGLSADERNGIRQQLGAAWNDGEAKIKDFINNDADYAYYQTYYQQEPERQEIGMMEASLAASETLDPATADALAAMQSDARKNYPFSVDFYNKQNWANPTLLNPGAINKFLDQQTQFQAQVAQQAAGILTPAQLDAYTQNQAAVRQMMKMQLNSLIQMSGGG